MSSYNTPIYYIKNGSLSFGDRIIFEDLDLYVHKLDKICLIGRNGSGKSSLMKVIYNEYEIDSGDVFVNPATSLGFLRQDNFCNSNVRIYDYLLSNLETEEFKYQADIILNSLEINGDDFTDNLSGGQVRRVELAKSLIDKPDILLMDEPTNHLDIKSIEWLEDYIKLYPGSIICVSHDRRFLSNITNKIWWLDRGYLRKSDKGYKYFDEWQDEVLKQEEENLRKLDKKLSDENLWLNQGLSARRKRNQKRLALLKSLRSQIKNHEVHLSNAKKKIELSLGDKIKKSNLIVEANDISFSYNDKKIIKNFSIRIKKGEKIGLIGPNGSGKSTLVKILIGELKEFSGKIKLGHDLDITYFDQHRSILNENDSLWETMCPSGGDIVFIRGKEMHVAAYLKKFLFDPKIIRNKINTLSGGEKNRLVLAKSLCNPGNLLILDEPTNDLDMDSLELLAEILADYEGTLILISHDRDFLEKIVTRTLVINENNEIIDLIGGYEDYLKFYKNSENNNYNINRKLPNKIHNIKIDNNNSNKLSYKYLRLLEILPGEIESIENKIKDLEKLLSDKEIFTKNPNKFYNITQELENSKRELDEKTEEWIKIEDMSKNI